MKRQHLEGPTQHSKRKAKLLSANPAIGLQGFPDTQCHGIALNGELFFQEAQDAPQHGSIHGRCYAAGLRILLARVVHTE